MRRTPSLEQETLVEQPTPAGRRATMRGSRSTGVLGFGAGCVVGAIFAWNVPVSGIVGFIVFAELPDVLYRLRARRGNTSPLLPAWDASEAYLVTLSRWRRRSRAQPEE